MKEIQNSRGVIALDLYDIVNSHLHIVVPMPWRLPLTLGPEGLLPSVDKGSTTTGKGPVDSFRRWL